MSLALDIIVDKATMLIRLRVTILAYILGARPVPAQKTVGLGPVDAIAQSLSATAILGNLRMSIATSGLLGRAIDEGYCSLHVLAGPAPLAPDILSAEDSVKSSQADATFKNGPAILGLCRWSLWAPLLLGAGSW
jgi:hypothetical protein